MNLPPNLFDTGPRASRRGMGFSLLVAIMVFLATLALAAQLIFGGGARLWAEAFAARATIEMQMDADEATEQKLNEAVAVLRTMPDMETVTPVPRTDVVRLLKPWIDDPMILTALPLPQLIDIQIQRGHKLDIPSITQALSPYSTDIRIDPHAAWMESLSRLVRSLSLIAGFSVVLIGVAFVIAIALVCRVAMAIQHETIDLLHLMGADDRLIAGQYQRRLVRHMWLPSLLGFLIACTTLGGLAFLFMHLRGEGLTLGMPWLVMGGALLTVPLCAVGVAAITARLSVLRLLKAMP